MGILFRYRLPEGVLDDNTLHEDGHITFQPLLFTQRCLAALGILDDKRWKKELKTVVDFGCSELRLVTRLRHLDHIDKIVAVDIDEDLLQNYKWRADPLASDYLAREDSSHKKPLRIEVFKGSIDAQVDQLRGIDAVIGLEVLQYLEPNVLDNIPENVFGFMQPKMAIFATPNRDYNVLFGFAADGLRDPHHKFEWNSVEFYMWAQEVCAHHPNYKVSFLGVGKPPPNQKQLGYCTQIALFVRSDVLGLPLTMPLQMDIAADQNPDIQYEQIHAVDFPLYRDERTKEKKILDETNFIVYSMRNNPLFFNRERRLLQIPISPLITFAASIDVSEEEVRTILREKATWLTAERLFLVLPECEDIEPVSDPEPESDGNADTPSAEEVANFEPEEDWS